MQEHAKVREGKHLQFGPSAFFSGNVGFEPRVTAGFAYPIAMTSPLRLHYAPDNASLCVRLALEACALPYETILVDRKSQAHKSAPFLKLNPNGLIPVLETPHGPMFETGAILLWIAEESDRLMPARGSADRQHALQWMMWLANTLHPTLRNLFYPSQFVAGDTAPLHAVARQRLVTHLDILDAADATPWLDDGAAPSAMGCYLAPMLRWAKLYGGGPEWFTLERWPRLLRFAQAAEEWGCSATAASAEGLGPTPFSNPSPCNPPEGSAL